MRVAIVHDWLVIHGGAERVLEQLIDLYPSADIFSLIDVVPDHQRGFLRGRVPITSAMQRIPGVARHYRKLLPIMPYYIEQFDFTGYDLVISSSFCVAKGALTGPNQLHVCYCHSPMRYAWDHYHEYLRETGLVRGPASWFARWQLHRIRTWDVRSANTVDHFVANSKFVQARIRKFYRRDAAVVHPPVDVDLFGLQRDKDDYYVAAGRFVPFKRLDLVAEAFRRMPNRRLVMLGDGPEMPRIRARAGPNVEFTGFLPPQGVRDYLRRARAFLFPSEEDFGIVPVEAQACGTPVIAYGSGGALETVVDLDDPGQRAPTGLFFAAQTAESIVAAVERFENESGRFSPEAIRVHAETFSPGAFRSTFAAEVERATRCAGWPA